MPDLCQLRRTSAKGLSEVWTEVRRPSASSNLLFLLHCYATHISSGTCLAQLFDCCICESNLQFGLLLTRQSIKTDKYQFSSKSIRTDIHNPFPSLSPNYIFSKVMTETPPGGSHAKPLIKQYRLV